MLQDISAGNHQRIDELIPHIYDEMRLIASKQLYSEKSGHTFNPTALTHEAYLKLIQNQQMQWKDRCHFFALSAIAMRRILVDYARSKKADKRGGEQIAITLDGQEIFQETRAEDLVILDEALERLKILSERQAKVVELWFFGGLSHQEIAEVIGISLPSVRRDWRLARAWLSREIRTQI